jgi:hypothetical protein
MGGDPPKPPKNLPLDDPCRTAAEDRRREDTPPPRPYVSNQPFRSRTAALADSDNVPARHAFAD